MKLLLSIKHLKFCYCFHEHTKKAEPKREGHVAVWLSFFRVLVKTITKLQSCHVALVQWRPLKLRDILRIFPGIEMGGFAILVLIIQREVIKYEKQAVI